MFTLTNLWILVNVGGGIYKSHPQESHIHKDQIFLIVVKKTSLHYVGEEKNVMCDDEWVESLFMWDSTPSFLQKYK